MELDGAALVIGGKFKHQLGSIHLSFTILTLNSIIASGIGGACARAFARCGTQALVIADIDCEAAEKVVADCEKLAKSQNFKGRAVKVDVGIEASVAEATKVAHEFLERIDYCVNSAGVSTQTTVLTVGSC